MKCEQRGKELQEQIFFLSLHLTNGPGQGSFLSAAQGYHNVAIYIYFLFDFCSQPERQQAQSLTQPHLRYHHSHFKSVTWSVAAEGRKLSN